MPLLYYTLHKAGDVIIHITVCQHVMFTRLLHRKRASSFDSKFNCACVTNSSIRYIPADIQVQYNQTITKRSLSCC